MKWTETRTQTPSLPRTHSLIHVYNFHSMSRFVHVFFLFFRLVCGRFCVVALSSVSTGKCGCVAFPSTPTHTRIHTAKWNLMWKCTTAHSGRLVCFYDRRFARKHSICAKYAEELSQRTDDSTRCTRCILMCISYACIDYTYPSSLHILYVFISLFHSPPATDFKIDSFHRLCLRLRLRLSITHLET